MSTIRRGIAAAIVASALVLPVTATHSADAAPKARTFKNCTAMNQVHKHGVGKTNARDKTSGTPVTTFKRNNALYKANTKSDRDKDGIACEKR
ncbi:MAG: excalibur calcium-binding domain-containing protein [Nocardioidaceae bacterium]|nr:excalibur calcium-binding domain-containing protein [Nocardioidaceae bacterium]